MSHTIQWQPRVTRTSPASLAGVRVLVCNDDSMQAQRPDGSDGLGLYEMRRALKAAGADVVVVAPWGPQSGSGTASSADGTVFAVERRHQLPDGFEDDDPRPVFGVYVTDDDHKTVARSATPSDAVRLGVTGLVQRELGWDGGPDLIVSGVNAGINVANFVNGSGTVGAVITALDSGIPAVAVSAGFERENFRVAPETYAATAEAASDIIARLWRRRMLTARFGINVNHPSIGELRSPRPVFTRVASGTFLNIGVTEGPAPDTYTYTGTICTPGTPGCLPETQRRPDAAYLLDKGRITVTPITANRTHRGPGSTRLALRLAMGL